VLRGIGKRYTMGQSTHSHFCEFRKKITFTS
jgi:hypothetical protein